MKVETNREITVNTPTETLRCFITMTDGFNNLNLGWLLELRRLTLAAIDEQKDILREDIRAKQGLLEAAGEKRPGRPSKAKDLAPGWSMRGKLPKHDVAASIAGSIDEITLPPPRSLPEPD